MPNLLLLGLLAIFMFTTYKLGEDAHKRYKKDLEDEAKKKSYQLKVDEQLLEFAQKLLADFTRGQMADMPNGTQYHANLETNVIIITKFIPTVDAVITLRLYPSPEDEKQFHGHMHFSAFGNEHQEGGILSSGRLAVTEEANAQILDRIDIIAFEEKISDKKETIEA